MLALPLRSSSPELYDKAWVAGMFASGEQGAWYEPSLSNGTCFQDAAGTIPVTAVEQPVGLMLDARATEIFKITRSDLLNTSKWGDGGPVVSQNPDGSIRITRNTDGRYAGFSPRIGSYALPPGCALRVKISVNANVGGFQFSGEPYWNWRDVNPNFHVSIPSGAPAIRNSVSVNFTGASIVTSGGISSNLFAFYMSGAYEGQFKASDYIDVLDFEITAYYPPATQVTSANRPVLSARYNLLLATTALSTKSVATVASSYVLSFSGTGTVTLSGTSSGVKSSGSNTFTCTAGTLTLTVSGTVSNASLVPANQSHLPYQRVDTATSYDADPIKFPAYLKFNGTNSWMRTGNIDFTGTDKMTVVAGVRKLSDAAVGMIFEHNGGYTNTTFFHITHAGGGVNDPDYNFLLSANVKYPARLAKPYTAPLSSVLAVSYNFAATSVATQVIPRINGVAATATSTGSVANSSGFANAPLFIGIRNGLQFPANMNLYSLIIRGAATDAAHITHAEKFVAYKSGVQL